MSSALVAIAVEATRESRLHLAADLLQAEDAPAFAREARAAGVTYTATLLVLYLLESRTLTDLGPVRAQLR